jgi:DNA-binding CsgD family transcriptional regulator
VSVQLSPRQRQCLALVAEGRTDREIARRMGVSVATAHRHVTELRIKLGARNRAHAVCLGLHGKLLTFNDKGQLDVR